MTLNLDTAHYEYKLRMIRYAIAVCLSLSLFIFMSIVILLSPAKADSINSTDFVTTWKTDNPGSSSSTSITLPMRGSNYSVDWNNDGTIDQTGLNGTITHDFGAPGTYTIRISQNHGGWSFFWSWTGDQKKLLSIDQWGSSPWQNMDSAFDNASNMTILAADAPNLTNVTSMRSAFRSSSVNSDLSHWNTSSVTDMTYAFTNATAFNGSLNGWNVSNVESMHYMFNGASSFNQPLNNWDVSSVTNMAAMFANTSSFNQPLNNWDVSNGPFIHGMFSNATAFNQPLDSWDVSSVTDLSSMFSDASSFNQPLDSWDVSSVTDLSSMFSDASSFNQPLDSWDVSSVTNMSTMFNGASSFNRPLSNWDVSSATNMAAMLANTSSFNQPLNAWDVSNVTVMIGMFNGASSFNQPLDSWDVSSVTNMSTMFYNASSFNQPLNSWNVSSATNLSYMFYNASSFNQPLNAWNVSNVTNMYAMFHGASIFNQSLGEWNVESLTDAYYMLYATSLSATNYDATLIGWAEHVLQQNVQFGETPSTYCLAASARQHIIDSYNWSITDEGNGCGTVYINGVEASAYNPIVLNGDQPSGVVVGTLTTDGFIPAGYQLTCGTSGEDDSLFTVQGDQLRTTVSLSATVPQDSDGDGIYEVCVRAYDSAGREAGLLVNVKVAAPKVITNVSFSEEDGEKQLIVSGGGFVDEAIGEATMGLYRSMVTLNGEPLKFCAGGTLLSILQSDPGSYDPQLYTTDQPCYYMYDFDVTYFMLTSTQAIIHLPDDFDTTAQGTVSVNGSAPYTFNAVTNPDPVDPETIQPTAYSNGTKPLNQNPVLPKRPTFSGVATPGATIVVTVHSDPVSCSATADSSGNWSCTLPSDLVPGAHTVYIQVTNPDGSIQNLGPYAVTVSGEGATISNNTPLAPNTGFMQMVQKYKQEQITNKSQAIILAGVALAAAMIATFAVYLVVKNQRRVVQFK